MSIRRVKQHSDRGSIKDIAKPGEAEDKSLPSASELRMKKLYEFAQATRNPKLQSAIGFITTDYISDKNALPLSVYRIKQMVEDIKATSAGKIDQLALQLEGCMKDEIGAEAIEYITKKRARVKTASVRKPPFWRVRKA